LDLKGVMINANVINKILKNQELFDVILAEVIKMPLALANPHISEVVVVPPAPLR